MSERSELAPCMTLYIHIGRLTLGKRICLHINTAILLFVVGVVWFDGHTHLPSEIQHNYDNLPVSPNTKVLTDKLHVVGCHHNCPLSGHQHFVSLSES